jgi:hypothetical protein
MVTFFLLPSKHPASCTGVEQKHYPIADHTLSKSCLLGLFVILTKKGICLNSEQKPTHFALNAHEKIYISRVHST